MTVLRPEHEEFWQDYCDAITDEFLIAQTRYLSTLNAQKLTLDRYVPVEPYPVNGSSPIRLACPTVHATEEMAAVDRDVYYARIQFNKAIGALQNMSIEACLKIINQIDLIQKRNPNSELDIGVLVRLLAVPVHVIT